jgi:DNA primase
VVDVIQSYIKLQKAGSNFKANCPFHNEKTPSFFVSPAREVWHCFGCGAGGDLIEFVKKIEGVEFPETLQILADRAGIELKKEDPRFRSEKTRLFKLMEAAAGFYESRLEENNAAQEYLAERGLKPETIKNFCIGYAPDAWREAVSHLYVCGFTDEEIKKAGLGIPSPRDGKVYDRFRGRIMFPINDFSGRIIGFSGRIVPFAAKTIKNKDGAEPAKYINTPQTALYDKSRALYGFDKAKLMIRKEDACIIVEGQMDVAMAHQAGVKNVVGISGTALTEWQYQAVSRLASRLIISLDKDLAGIARSGNWILGNRKVRSLCGAEKLWFWISEQPKTPPN